MIHGMGFCGWMLSTEVTESTENTEGEWLLWVDVVHGMHGKHGKYGGRMAFVSGCFIHGSHGKHGKYRGRIASVGDFFHGSHGMHGRCKKGIDFVEEGMKDYGCKRRKGFSVFSVFSGGILSTDDTENTEGGLNGF